MLLSCQEHLEEQSHLEIVEKISMTTTSDTRVNLCIQMYPEMV